MTNHLVTPVLRAVDLLEWLARGGQTDNLSAAARETGINRATLTRLLATFRHAGILSDAEGDRVGFGGRMLHLSSAVLAQSDLTQIAAHVLPDVAVDLGLSTYLVTLDGADVVYLQQHLPQAPIVSLMGIGSRVPATQTAPGRALLAGNDTLQWSRSGLEAGVGAAALCVRRRDRVVAAISVAGPQQVVDAVADRIEPRLRQAAAAIALG